MRTLFPTAAIVAALTLLGARLNAQQPSDSAARAQQRALDSLSAAIRALRARVDSLAAARGADARPDSAAGAAQTTSTTAATQGRPAGMYMNIGFSGLADFGWSTESNVGSLQLGDHDPAVRGFTIPNEEITLDGSVDPYFKGFVNTVFKLDPNGESHFELEEAYFLTNSLPANLQIKGGQFLTEFGRQNQQHPHAWAWVDQPLVLNRMFGPDGLRGQGARISWLAPSSFYAEAMVTVINSAGETAFSFRSEESSEIHGGVPLDRGVEGLSDMVVLPRLTTSFDITGTQTLLLGVSGAFGPNNSGSSSRTQIYGADVYWRWKSAFAHQGFPFFSVQSEVLYRRYEAADRQSAEDPLTTLPAETLTDQGVYAQVLWGIKPRWVAGLRVESAGGSTATFSVPLRDDRFRFSPNLTWYPSEFSKLRLQYNYDHRQGPGRDHSLWLQFEFLLGAHAAHRF